MEYRTADVLLSKMNEQTRTSAVMNEIFWDRLYTTFHSFLCFYYNFISEIIEKCIHLYYGYSSQIPKVLIEMRTQ